MARKKNDAQDEQPKPRRSRGEGSISQRKDGRFMVRIPIGDGKRKTEYFDTRAEAERGKRRMLNERDDGKLVTQRDQTLEEYLNYWLETNRLLVKETTYISRSGYLRGRFIPALGHV